MNCKPGDLAVIVTSPINPDPVGCIVEVLKRSHDVHGLPAWMVKFSDTWTVRHSATGKVVQSNCVNCPDAWMRPISGVPVHDEEEREVTA